MPLEIFLLDPSLPGTPHPTVPASSLLGPPPPGHPFPDTPFRPNACALRKPNSHSRDPAWGGGPSPPLSHHYQQLPLSCLGVLGQPLWGCAWPPAHVLWATPILTIPSPPPPTWLWTLYPAAAQARTGRLPSPQIFSLSGGEIPRGEPRREGVGGASLRAAPQPLPAPSPAGRCSGASAAPHCYAPHIPSPRAAARQELGSSSSWEPPAVPLAPGPAASLPPEMKNITPKAPAPRLDPAPPSSWGVFCPPALTPLPCFPVPPGGDSHPAPPVS